MARRATRLLAILALLLCAVGCDHATKAGAKAALEGKAPLALLDGVLELRYAENRDTAFSLFDRLHVERSEPLLLAISLVGLVALSAAWWYRRGARPLEHAGFALAFAGAVGNVGERFVRGYVVDFIHVAFWPIFNVADVVIVVGAFLLFLSRRTPSGVPPRVAPKFS